MWVIPQVCFTAAATGRKTDRPSHAVASCRFPAKTGGRWQRPGAFLPALLIAALGAGVPAAAQSLTEALSEAYRSNPQLVAQRALLRATDELVPQALANWRPTVAFTGQTGYAVSASSVPGGPTAYSHSKPSSLDLTATQQVYRGGRTEAQVRQAINTVEATRAQTLAVETTVFQAVAQAYLDVVRDQDLLAVNRNNEYVLGQEFESTRIRVEIGELTGTDLAQAQAALEQAKAQVVTAEGQLEISRANYTRAVGRPPGHLTVPRERPVLPATREGALSLAARASIASFTAAVRAAQIALVGIQEEALAGTRTVLDVLVAEQQLFTTQAQLVTAEHDSAIAEFNVAAATGRLIAPELRLPVHLYDMSRHYKAVKDKWIGFAGGLSQ